METEAGPKRKLITLKTARKRRNEMLRMDRPGGVH
jgi:hypothetical protein